MGSEMCIRDRYQSPKGMQTAPKAASLARIPRSSLHFRSLPRTTSFHTNTIAVTGAIIAPLTFAIMQQPMATASVRLFFRLGSRSGSVCFAGLSQVWGTRRR